MTTGAFIFLVVSWTAVLGVAGWAFSRVLSSGASDRRLTDSDPDEQPGS